MGVVLLMFAASVAAQDLPPEFDQTFAVSSVDIRLMVDADAIVRLNLLRFEVENAGKATQTVRRVVTVLGPDGRDEGELYIVYDNRLQRLKKLTGQLRDASGSVLRKLEKADQEDYSAVAGYSLYDDTRVRVARLYHHVYPYTVEFTYEILHDGLINWPTWYPQERGLAVVLGRFDLVAPADVEVRHTAQGTDVEPIVFVQHGRQMLRWSFENQPPVVVEPFGPAWQDQVSAVHTAPTTFEIEGTRGDMQSWKAFGRWYHGLNEGRTALPAEARTEVHRLISGVSDNREKVRRLYGYLQENTRYVSIQLGLGGWQSFDAAYVHERGYGDCKALTTYLRALLQEAGIESFPALIRAGERAPTTLVNFPSNQFNHVILYVDLGGGDSVWLESTSQTIPFGHLGTFTEDRSALLITPEGGVLIRTPRSGAQNNTRVSNARVHLSDAGDATLHVDARFTGNRQDEIRQRLTHRSGRERTAWLVEHVGLPSFEVISADFSEVDGKTLSLTVPMELQVVRYASRAGRRLFVPLHSLERPIDVPPPAERRAQPIKYFPYAFIDIDTTRVLVPEGFAVEAIPDPVEIETSFGRFATDVAIQGDSTLVYYRQLLITETTLPAEQYPAFRDFLLQIAQADRSQAVLIAQ